MVGTLDIREHMEVIGADGAFVGKVDKVEGNRIKLTKDDGHGGKRDHHHFLPIGLVADIEGDKVRLSATGANALNFQEEEAGAAVANEAANPARDSAFAFDTSQNGGKIDTTPAALTDTASGEQSQLKGLGLGTAALAAVGAAAVGAAALGAAKLIKGRNEDALPLEDDENMRLISSAKVEGTKVFDRDGATIGSIQSFMVDKYSGRVAYAVLSFGGTFGLGASLFPLPWASLDYDDDLGGYRLGLTKDQLAEAPKFQANDAPEFDGTYRQRILVFYRGM